MDFIAKIENYRKERGLSKTSLACEFGICRAMLYNYYKGALPKYHRAKELVKIVPDLTMKDCGYEA